MIVGIGLDLVDIERIEDLLHRRGEHGLRRLFSPDEIAYCRARSRPAESYAARFAAKEAFFKAIGTGWGSAGLWTEIEVVPQAGGAPELRLSGSAAESARERGVRRARLSLSHTADVAAAVVVLEG
jgi:holo-[acyl-carrier protein] synthase